jgi:ribosomal protein S18 acetylase RimI-like enzyme
MRFEQLEESGYPEAAEFVARLNREPEHHVGYCATEPDEVLSAMREDLAGAILARSGGSPIGFLGFDADKGRAYLWGPFVAHSGWESGARELYWRMLRLLPEVVRELEVFCAAENSNCRRFAAREGFEPRSEELVYTLERDARARLPEGGVEELAYAEHPAFRELHDGTFPGTYYSGTEILARRSGHRKVFVVREGGELAGYAYAEVEPEFGAGSVEFIGVREGLRRRGIGGRLLAGAVAWIFSFGEVREVSLVVNAGNPAAGRLYESAGFSRRRRLVSLRRKLNR